MKSSAQVFWLFQCHCWQPQQQRGVSDAQQLLSFHLHLPWLTANNQDCEGIWKENAMWRWTWVQDNWWEMHPTYTMPTSPCREISLRLRSTVLIREPELFWSAFSKCIHCSEMLPFPTNLTSVFRASHLHSVEGALEKSKKSKHMRKSQEYLDKTLRWHQVPQVALGQIFQAHICCLM